MPKSYSLYEAKAQLSALVKMVREGRTVVITVHGKPAVEMRPVTPAAASQEERIEQLAEQGVVVRRQKARTSFKPVARRSGALKRFLEERD